MQLTYQNISIIKRITDREEEVDCIIIACFSKSLRFGSHLQGRLRRWTTEILPDRQRAGEEVTGSTHSRLKPPTGELSEAGILRRALHRQNIGA
jgi:hypothetical protein